jgi:hypothetical protein
MRSTRASNTQGPACLRFFPVRRSKLIRRQEKARLSQWRATRAGFAGAARTGGEWLLSLAFTSHRVTSCSILLRVDARDIPVPSLAGGPVPE